MDPELQKLLEAVTTVANTEFTNRYMGGVYGELMNVHTDARGYIKLFAQAEGAMFERWRGKGNVSSITEGTHKILADLFTYSKEIPIRKWDQLMAWLGNNWPGMLATAGRKAAFKFDEVATELLDDAVGGTSPNSLYGTSMWLGEVTIPGSDGKKFSNREDLGELTEDNLREAYYQAIENLAERVCADGSPYFDIEDMATQIRLMYAPTAKLTRLINKVFDTGRTSSRDQVDKITDIMVKPNQIWLNPKFKNLNGADAGGIMFYYPNMGNLRAFQAVQTEEGIGLEDDLPLNQDAAQKLTRDQQLNRHYTFTATKDMEVGAGTPSQFLWFDADNIR